MHTYYIHRYYTWRLFIVKGSRWCIRIHKRPNTYPCVPMFGLPIKRDVIWFITRDRLHYANNFIANEPLPVRYRAVLLVGSSFLGQTNSLYVVPLPQAFPGGFYLCIDIVLTLKYIRFSRWLYLIFIHLRNTVCLLSKSSCYQSYMTKFSSTYSLGRVVRSTW